MLFLGTGTCWRGVAVFILKAGAATTTSDSLIRRSLGKSQKKISCFTLACMNIGIQIRISTQYLILKFNIKVRFLLNTVPGY
jgi:hypothetical protein